MYKKILAALDGSQWSNLAIDAIKHLAEKNPSGEVLGCHVYAAALHRDRFAQMEPGLPERYQEEERLENLRNTHESLITDGMQLISDAYLAPLVRALQESGFTCKGATPEGPNSLKLLNLIDEYQPRPNHPGSVGARTGSGKHAGWTGRKSFTACRKIGHPDHAYSMGFQRPSGGYWGRRQPERQRCPSNSCLPGEFFQRRTARSGGV